ncbi:MAG: zinc-finger domain-containing protein [Magnetococcales bacterium]|jgi:uncharacterized Zn-finger protein|nr:zinc-finger domain-containing protein [Magnetococcales bacterium]MEC8067714.1 zinc-finger domain-containing protein [Pseudomonadota bacterium]|tara:strand:+ start:35691 stop:35885 length:195 start_codon:yes stop_codon:yes gene_type:complete
MSEYIKPTTTEVEYVTSDKVACDGPKFSKHPRVYLTVVGGTKNEVVCPYCGRIFRHEQKQARAS